MFQKNMQPTFMFLINVESLNLLCTTLLPGNLHSQCFNCNIFRKTSLGRPRRRGDAVGKYKRLTEMAQARSPLLGPVMYPTTTKNDLYKTWSYCGSKHAVVGLLRLNTSGFEGRYRRFGGTHCTRKLSSELSVGRSGDASRRSIDRQENVGTVHRY
jgi:hypothetical protein